MGAQSTVRRPPSGARQQAGALMPLAPCPVEGCPAGGCIPTISTSASQCSLRCSGNSRLTFVNLRPQPVSRWKTAAVWLGCICHRPEFPILGHFPKGKSCPNRVNQPLPEIARNNPRNFPPFRPFQRRIRPRLPKRELAHFPVHGYDISSSPSPPISGSRPRRQTDDPFGTRTRLLPIAATGTPGPDCASAPSNHPPCEGGLCTSPPHAPLLRRFRLVRLDGGHHKPTWWRRRRESAIDHPTIPQRSQGTGQSAYVPLPMSRRGLSDRGCTPPMPPSASNCSLRFSRVPRRQPTCTVQFFGASPFAKVLATSPPDLHSPRLFHVGKAIGLAPCNHRQIPVHGYDRRSRPFPPVAPKGRTRESSHMRHGVPSHGSPHSTVIRPAVTARCTPMRAR